MKRFLLILNVFYLSASTLNAQVELVPERFLFEPGLELDAGIPSPEQFLGYALGTEFSIYARVVEYVRALAASSDRVVLRQYGRTYEGRPLINLVITSPENHQRLEEIRQEHLRLSDPSAISQKESERLLGTQPVFTSLSYNIHGNEASSTEAAMQVAYRMAAARDAETRRILEQSVIIMYICINPDGRDRYVYWYNSVVRNVVATHPNDLEHYEPWPNGRTNHYWFDLNRDWVWGVHPESRGHAAEYQRWMPQVHVDYHEQGYNSNYFTMPGTTPRNLLLPDAYEPLTDYFGRRNIAEFDKHQINYFTRDGFDFFYPGYGSSYPSVMGAIGMLTEQGGIGGGLAVKTDDGYVLTFRQRIFDHYTTCVATIKGAVEKREELLRYSFQAWNPGKSKSPVKAYLLPADQGGYLVDVLGILQRHGVRVEQAQEDFTAQATAYRSGKMVRQGFKKGDFIIFTDQPRHLLIHAVMERDLETEDSVMYDMSTWSAPLAFNLEAFSTDQRPGVRTTVLAAVTPAEGQLENPEAGYAFVVDWDQRHAPKALSMLWRKGYRVRSALEPFSDGRGGSFSAGSLIILRGRNQEKSTQISTDLEEIARETGVRITGFDTGRMAEGYDLASTRNRPLEQPKVALMVDPPFDAYTCGQLYFLFDRETLLPVERIRTSVLQQTSLPKFGQRYGLADLNDYQVLILPGGGNYLGEVFGKDKLEELKAWVSRGGVLIAAESAALFFTDNRSKMTKVKWQEMKKDSSDAARFLAYADREDFYGKKRIPGAALRAEMDITHPLAFGLKPELYSLKFDINALLPDPDLQTVGRYGKDPEALLAGGYASTENLQHLAGKAFAAVLPVGQGKIVFLLDNTQYRMFWRGPSRIMQNAVMLLPGF